MTDLCPQCGSAAILLFNLVACVGTGCRNYEEAWHVEWQQNNQPRFRHNPVGDHNPFMGVFSSSKGMTFDLYAGDDGNGNSLAIARAGHDDSQCFYVDEKETEIGTLATGPIKTFHSCVAEALKSALKRLKATKKKAVAIP